MSSLIEKRALVADLRNPPIIEGVLDIDCDMPPGLDFESLREPGLRAFGEQYPIAKKHFIAGHHLEKTPNQTVKLELIRGLQGLRFAQRDGQQLIQIRTQGFSFNRLAPYSALDDYMPEIERTYRLFLALAKPVQIRRVGLRYINKIMLPFHDEKIELDQYLEKPPRLPTSEEMRFHLRSFLHHDTFVEVGTGNEINRILTFQPPEKNHLPLIFDNAATRSEMLPPDDWPHIRATVLALRSLKNEIFADTLTKGCLKLFQ